MTSQVKDDKKYLSDELNTVENTIRKSTVIFEECVTKVVKAFETNFEKLRTAVKVRT